MRRPTRSYTDAGRGVQVQPPSCRHPKEAPRARLALLCVLGACGALQGTGPCWHAGVGTHPRALVGEQVGVLGDDGVAGVRPLHQRQVRHLRVRLIRRDDEVKPVVLQRLQ